MGDFLRRMKPIEGNSEVVKIGDQKLLRTAEGVSVAVIGQAVRVRGQGGQGTGRSVVLTIHAENVN